MALLGPSADSSLDPLEYACDAQTNSLCYKISTIIGLFSIIPDGACLKSCQ